MIAPKTKTLFDRITSLEQAILFGKEYLESGEHADWHKFRSLFIHKMKDGKELPPHPDWVKNVFLPSNEKALARAEKLLERLEAQQEELASETWQKVVRELGKTCQ